MAVTLDHTIVQASDNLASAWFLADILGLAVPETPAHFTPVVTDNDVVLDFMTVDAVMPHHYAFTVSPATFDEAFTRVRAGSRSTPSQIAAAEARLTSASGSGGSISTTPTAT